MAEYIEREAAIKMMRGSAISKYPLSFSTGILAAADELQKMPTADVAPVVHGRWKNGDPYCPVCGKDKFAGLDADVWADWKPDYCPNCGSKMIGE